MRKLLIRLIVSFGSFIALQGATMAQEAQTSHATELTEKTVVATGYADIRAAGESEAYDRAIEDAQRKSIEEALGTFVDSRTITEKGVLIKDQISGRSAGYIKTRKELKRWMEGQMVYVQLELTIGMDILKDDVLALKMAQDRMKMPRVVIFVKESYLGRDDVSTTGTVYSTLLRKLAEKQFTIVNHQSLAPSAEENQMVEALANQGMIAALAQKVGAMNGADIVIAGAANAQDAGTENLYGSAMRSYQARVALQVVNVGDARVIAATEKQGASPHISPEQGCSAALKRVAQVAADDLIAQVQAKWDDILQSGNLLTLRYSGLSVVEGLQFQKALKQYFREVKEVYDKGAKDGVSICMVQYLGDAREFATALSTVPDFPYSVEAISYDAVAITIKVTPR